MRRLDLSIYEKMQQIDTLSNTSTTHDLLKYLTDKGFIPIEHSEILITTYNFYEEGWCKHPEWLNFLNECHKKNCTIRVLGKIPQKNETKNMIKNLIDKQILTSLKTPIDYLDYHIFAISNPAITWVSSKHNGKKAKQSQVTNKPIQRLAEDAFKSFDTEWNFSFEIVNMSTCVQYYLSVTEGEIKFDKMMHDLNELNQVLFEHGVSERAGFIPDSIIGVRNRKVSDTINDLWLTGSLKIEDDICTLTSDARKKISNYLKREDNFAYTLLCDFCPKSMAA